ncbi:unnamed protein product [Cylicostephanus goldi]|uniref:Replication protein A OB domain-containing protein n=1 Tax=Cylicostephanus goldi TaxID=71465 RepID=A0A3P7QC56_CYLGO|nr:unnamed protein product [Cylicostephanus goldi]
MNAEKGGDIIAITRSYIDFGTLLGKKGESTGKPMLMIVEYELLARGHSILSAGVSHDGDKQLRVEEFCESDIIPISSITPYVSRWRICGLCTSKDNLRKYKRSAGDEVTVLCFELTDRDGAALRITGFDEVAEKLFPIIEIDRFISRDGRHCVKRDLSLIDESNAVVQLTLWNDRAENFEEKSLGHVISIKGAMVKHWSGTFSLGIAPSSKIEINPQIDGSVNLADWFANKRKSVDVKRISKPVYNGDNFD